MSYTSDTGAFAFFQTSKIRSGEGSREVVYREDEEKMRLAKLVLSITACAVSTVFAGDVLLKFDKTDPTATCILTAERCPDSFPGWRRTCRGAPNGRKDSLR